LQPLGVDVKLCRFNGDRLGLVRDSAVFDITDRFDRRMTWPAPQGDFIAMQIAADRELIAEPVEGQPTPIGELCLQSPVANPSKIIGAPINYKAHIEEANADAEISQGHTYTSLDRYGLFLKANSSLCGSGESIRIRFDERRTDHEVELAVVIGRRCGHVERKDALDYVLGYTVGLDLTVRGQEFPSFRKSPDTYCVLGPWLVTPDEAPNPNNLDLSLKVNGELRQASNTKAMIFDVQRLIEYASSFYTLYPGDVIMTGTPEGVGQVQPGDLLEATVENIGTMRVSIAA
jgi:2-keto-4-pentenoate hydratase/2-oxohepta-3-ene-1,7-dioic acid hydratase in catechol pathway